MKLNPSKCAFGVASRNFLGFMVSYRRIENPSNLRHGAPEEYQERPKPHWMSSCP